MEMSSLEEKLKGADWPGMAESLNETGFVRVKNLLSPETCKELTEGYDDQGTFRKAVTMERYRFGLGEYKYYRYPLPHLIQTIREKLYPHLVPIANRWMEVLKMDVVFPPTHSDLLTRCRSFRQDKPTVLILKYGKGGFNTLHQDLYGEVYFPIQAVLFLSDPGEDYTGGEFVLTEQTPRSQSKATVLKPEKGDMLLFTTNFRPVKGRKGYYRATIKHGVSEISSGTRLTLGIVFHDALN